jgi:DNA (cytosine-5)-methyltransferase 1
MGYHRAGFDVVGVDINPQPDYPFEFHRADATTYPLDGFDALHGSPPCHDHSTISPSDDGTGWMLPATVERFAASGKPWVVENVVGPDVRMAGWWFVLCGSMFGMQVRRHRRFGSSHLMMPPACRHDEQGRPFTITGHGGGCESRHSKKPPAHQFWRYLDMPWMEGRPPYGVAQAIPPAYTEWIGERLIDALAVAA